MTAYDAWLTEDNLPEDTDLLHDEEWESLLATLPAESDVYELLGEQRLDALICRAAGVCGYCQGKGSREYRIWDATGRYPLYFDGVCQECGGTGARKDRAA